MSDLTDRQQEVLTTIEEFIAEMGYAPSMREIVDRTSITSTCIVSNTLNRLEEKGYIERTPGISRGIRLTSKIQPSTTGGHKLSVRKIPIAGQIGASAPAPTPDMSFACFGHDETLEINMALLPLAELGRQLFALRVGGYSMIDAGIESGDYVILAPAAGDVSNGDIVAALLTETAETTLKYYYKEGSRVRLQPANKEMAPIIVELDAIEVQGHVIMVFRQTDILL